MEQILAIGRDVRYGARTLRREIAFSLTALLTLTVGIATTTTVFSVVDAELWKPLPFSDPRQLAAVQVQRTAGRFDYVSGAELADWKAGARLARYVATATAARRVLRVDGRTESVSVRPVTSDFFEVLGVVPRLGRTLNRGDEYGAHLALLSDAGWARLFNRDPSVIGAAIAIDGEAHAIVGVLAAPLQFLSETDLFAVFDPAAPTFRDYAARTLDVYARIQPDARLAEAQAELQALAARTVAAHPEELAGRGVRLTDLQQASSGFNWREMYFFFAAAVLVLALACLNVAGLLLARALKRQRELAIRTALGGARGTLIRQLLVEGGLLAIPGAVFGTLAASWLIALLRTRIPPEQLERGGQLHLDARTAVFVLVVTTACTLVLTLAPLLFVRRLDLSAMLSQNGRVAGSTPRQRRSRSLLLTTQVTVTLVLLVGAALFAISFFRLSTTPLGFDPANRIAARVTLSGPRYASDPAVIDFATRLIENASTRAGVHNPFVASNSPLDSRGGASVHIVSRDRPRPPRGQESTALIRSVTPGYLPALGIRHIAGRDFSSLDAAGAPRVAIVNALLVERLFPGENPIGRELEIIPRVRTGWTNRPGTVVIVGVVANVRNLGINEIAFNSLYLPFAQAPSPSFELVATTGGLPGEAVKTLRAAVQRTDASVPIMSVGTLDDRVDAALRADRFNLLVVVFFACCATLLAGVGIYGAVACAVQERTREFGIRVALGALPRRILGSALAMSVWIGLAGGALGAAIVLLIARAIGDALYLVPNQHGGLLYGVKTTDPLAIGAAFAVLMVVVIVAALIPARHATSVDPVIALRAE